MRPNALLALPAVGLLLLLSGPVQADEPALGGRVVDELSGEPVPGAVVSVVVEGGATVLTDAGGHFQIDTVPDGTFTLVVQADLYQLATLRVRRGADLPIELETASSETIVVQADAPATGTPASYELEAEEIRLLPGSGNDTLKALQSLPGAARVPFGLGGLILRGTAPRDTNVYLDGVEVPILYHFGGLASFYPSSMLASVDMMPGGWGVTYGRGQGGLVTLSSRPARADRWRASGEVSLIDSQVRAEGPGPAGGAWTIGLRRSYVDAVLALALSDDDLDLTIAPRYYDGQLRYELERRPGERITATLFGSDDRMQFDTSDDPDDPTDDQFDYNSRFLRLALRYQRRDGDLSYSVTPWTGIDRVAIILDGDEGLEREAVPMGIRADVARTTGPVTVAGGLDLAGGRFSAYLNSEPPPMLGPDGQLMDEDDEVLREFAEWYADLGFWTEALVRLDGGRLGIRPGLRLERYGLTDEWVLDPRLTVTHELPAGITLRESIGLYHQPPAKADVDPIFGDKPLSSSYAIQASVGADVKLPVGVEVGVTGFAGELYDLPADVVTGATPNAGGGQPQSGGAASASRELLDEQFGTYSYQENVGRGRTYGVEALARRAVGNFIGWVSYTWSRSFRRGDPALEPSYRPYVLDQPHVLTVIGSLALPRNWRFGARFRYVSGNPITPVAGTFYDTDDRDFVPIDGPILSERLPAFAQLDLRVDRTWLRDWGRIGFFLDLQNVTNRVNPEGVTYNHDYTELQYTRGLPVFPSLGVEVVY
jgi:hypothetical protein